MTTRCTKKNPIFGKIYPEVRKVSVLLAFSLFGIFGSLMAQKEGAIWYFGQNAGLDFNQYYPKPLTNGKTETREGVATICDKEGNLLFYTDGQTVYNRNHQMMVNGDGLYGDISSTQSSIIVPKPGKQLEYYIFTVDQVGTASDPGKGLNYSIVDLLQSPPLGRVTSQKNILLQANSTERITAVKHKNGTDYWIIAHGWNNWVFHVFLLDKNGIRAYNDIGVGTEHRNTDPNDRYNRGATGYLKSSPKGDYLVVAIEGLHIFELFSFNNETAEMRLIARLPAGTPDSPQSALSAAYGVEFSPTSNYLYGSTRQGGFIYQWDLSQPNEQAIIQSMKILRQNNSILCGALQLGFNGKIYVALSGQPYLGVINSPIQSDCNYVEHGASLFDNETGRGGKSYFGLPTFLPDFFKAAEFYYENTCQNDTTLFYLSTKLVVGRPDWQVFDSTSTQFIGRVDVDATLDGKFKFPKAGKYWVELRVQQFGYPEPTVQRQEITIHQLPELNFPDTTSLCKGSLAVLDAGYGAFYNWKDNENLNVERYRSVGFPGKYVVTVRHYNGCSNTDSTEVVEKPLPVIADTIVGKAACGYDNGSIRLLMESDTSNYLFEWKDYPDVHKNEMSALQGGVYEVKITSKITGCSITSKLSVSEENAPDVKVKASVTGAVCPGTKVTLTAEGAANYKWYNPEGIEDFRIQVEPWITTTYIVKGYSLDSNQKECSAFAEVTVDVHPYVLPELGAPKEKCQGDTVKLDGGDMYNAWEWSTGQTSQIIRLTENWPELILRVTDRNGCKFSDTTSVLIKLLPEVDLGLDRIVCKGTQVILDGGEADTWLWNTSDTTRTISAENSMRYEVTVTKQGCSASDQVNIRINSPDSLRIDSVAVQDVSCYGAANGSIRIFVKGEGSTYQYSIDDGDTFFENQGLFENLDGSAAYRIRVIEDSVCSVRSDDEFEIREPEPIEIDYRLISPSCEQCEDGEITLIISGGTPPYSVLWSTMDSVKRLRNIGLGTYPVWIRDSLKCSAYKNIDMVLGETSYSIPNAFTPNGDGVNEKWVITALKDKPDCIVQVFTRAGRKIFESEKGYKEPWDGRDPDGNVVPVGSYFYLIRVDDSTKPLTGSVTVLK